MKKAIFDWRLLLGLFIAHVSIYLTFDYSKVFWYILTATSLFLISYSTFNEEMDDQVSVIHYLLFGVLSGLLLYCLFWTGNSLINLFNITAFQNQITRLYHRFSPEQIWHYIVLILIVVPGEEYFWRGFILKRLNKAFAKWPSLIVAAFLYGSAYIYSGSAVLMFAAVLSGIVWGYLYVWKKSLPLNIMSHLTFDLLLFVFFPLI